MLGLRFVIFCFLFGLNRKSHRSRSQLRSLFNLQLILENKFKICQSELIEPTLSGICAPVLIFLTTPSAPFASDLPRFSKKKASSVGILFAKGPKMP